MLKYKNEVILTIFSVFFTLICVEIFFRYSPLYSGPISLPDTELGYVFRKNVERKMTNPESHEQMTIKTNSFGFPDKEWNLNSTSSRIMVVGDSFVAGFETQSENRFTNLLETKLNSSSTEKYEVENWGVPGSGPEAYILRIKKYFKEVNPDYVVFVIYNGNDFANANYDLTPDTGRINYKVVNAENEKSVKRYSEMATTQEKIKWYIKTFVGKLLLVQFLNDVYLKTKTSNLATSPSENTQPEYCAYSKIDLENSQLIANNILLQAKEIAGDKLIVLDVPDKKQVHFTDTENCKNNVIEKELENFTKEQNIKYISTLSDFEKSTSSMYYVEHLNVSGHQKVSEILFNYISSLQQKSLYR